MKPYLLVLLLAIPPMVCSLLTSECSDPTDTAVVATKSESSDASTTTSTSSTTTTIPPRKQAPANKPAPSQSATAQARPWFM